MAIETLGVTPLTGRSQTGATGRAEAVSVRTTFQEWATRQIARELYA